VVVSSENLKSKLQSKLSAILHDKRDENFSIKPLRGEKDLLVLSLSQLMLRIHAAVIFEEAIYHPIKD
jgi:hypothetical protein